MLQTSRHDVKHKANLRANRIFCIALPFLVHLLNTNAHMHEESALPNAVSPSSDLRYVRVQRPQYPDWVRKVIECLRFRFRDELDYMLRTIKAVNESLFQEFQDIQEEPSPVGRQECVPLPGERNRWMSIWRELLNTRPKLYARLIGTLDSVISWGGPLAETDTPFPFSGRHEPPGPGLHQYIRAEKAALPLSPLLSSTSSHRNTEKTSPSPTCGGEPVSHVENCRANATFLRPAVLNGEFDSILFQQMNSPESQLNEEVGEILSPISPNPSSAILRDEIMDSGSTVLDQPYVCDGAKGVIDDFRATDEFILGDGQNDDWIGAVLAADMALSGDDMSKGPDSARADACITL